jgi:ribonuclease HI
LKADATTLIAIPHVEIYTDGGCEPNPGPGGYGVVLLHPKTRKRDETSGGFRLTTNNRMEIFAAIAGLEKLKQPCKVTLYSDSQYVVKAMMEGWVATWTRKGWWRTNKERRENFDLWQKLDELCQKHQVEFRWVKGHAGILENERCDQLSMAALRQPNLPADEGYENKPEIEGVRPENAQRPSLSKRHARSRSAIITSSFICFVQIVRRPIRLRKPSDSSSRRHYCFNS